MSELRWLSIIFGITILLFTFGYRHQRQRNSDRVLFFMIAFLLILLGIYPNWINGILRTFSFEQGNSGRIIGLLLGAMLMIYLMVFRLQSQITAQEYTISRLVNELAKYEYRKEKQTEQRPLAPVCVVIPAYNEENNIRQVLTQIPNMIGGLDVSAIVMVDGGTDQTEQVVRDFDTNVATHIINRGGGAALHAGYDLALDAGAQVIVSMDADGQHVPGQMERLVLPILRGDADMVNGSRVLGVYEKDQFVRAMGVVLFNWLVSILTVQRITDCSNGYRAISSDALAEVRPKLRQRQYHSSELLIEVIKTGRRVIEVPITIKRRASGESKKGPTLRYAFGFVYAIISTWLR